MFGAGALGMQGECYDSRLLLIVFLPPAWCEYAKDCHLGEGRGGLTNGPDGCFPVSPRGLACGSLVMCLCLSPSPGPRSVKGGGRMWPPTGMLEGV